MVAPTKGEDCVVETDELELGSGKEKFNFGLLLKSQSTIKIHNTMNKIFLIPFFSVKVEVFISFITEKISCKRKNASNKMRSHRSNNGKLSPPTFSVRP